MRIFGTMLLALIAATALPAAADPPLVATYQSHAIRFTHVTYSDGGIAIGIADPGFATLLRETGAVLTYKPGDRYVLITTSVPVVVSFALGDRRYDVGPISLQASFAPYQQGNEVYLPFNEVLGSLYLALRQEGPVSVLQPQLATLDVHAQGDRVTLEAYAGAALHPRVVQESSSTVTYEFDGVGTTLAGSRTLNAGGVRTMQISQTGTLRDPKTLVTVQLAPGALHDVARITSDRSVELGFSGSGSAAPAPSVAAVAAAAPASAQAPEAQPGAVQPAASPSQGPAIVTGVTLQSTSEGQTVAIAVTGNATYEWHRLRDPDNRFWVDIKGAQLQGPPVEQPERDPLISLRVRQNDPETVRIALSFTGPKSVDLSPSATGLNVDVGNQDVADDMSRSGTGSVGTVISSGEQTALVTPAPLGEPGAGAGDDSNWKFGPRTPVYVPTNPRLIVIDPGHGGSDTGAAHAGVTEAEVNLDTAKRLRDILIARGWQVQMTRDTDVDVYAPDDTAHQELQARVDVANNAGARLFVSIHANSFINSGPYGTTCYISKSSDVAFARMVERQLVSDGTKDDGIVKSHLYVTLHTLMPAVLVETAFLSNPSDFALLTSPAWRQKVAQAIADGIGQYTQAYPVPNQPAQ